MRTVTKGLLHVSRWGLLLAAGLLVAGQLTPAVAATPGNELLVGEGLDSCTAPSVSQMSAFWSNTPYSAWGVYIGGEDRACSQPNLTASWVSSVTAQGWHLLPLWVGPQNPCVPGYDHFSTNTSTAYSQGVQQALDSYSALTSLGIGSNSPVIYDLETGGASTTTCIDATKSFIHGWVNQVAGGAAQWAGGSTPPCGGFMDAFASLSPPPDFIDGADWDGNPSTGTLSCVSSGHWTEHQRHKQYEGGHNETYNGVTLNVDSTCSNGPTVALAPFNGNSACL